MAGARPIFLIEESLRGQGLLLEWYLSHLTAVESPGLGGASPDSSGRGSGLDWEVGGMRLEKGPPGCKAVVSYWAGKG